MIEHLKALCPGLTAEQAERFETYYALLIEWNKTRNLTAITEPAEVAQKHFFDSLAAAPLLIVYPFLQKYFAKGVMVGAVKG